MNPSVKAQWVAALKSGEYEQGKGALREPKDPMADASPDCFCCLGVLCDLYAKDFLGGRWSLSDLEDTAAALPGSLVSMWADFDETNDPHITVGGVTDRISRHNDNGATFAEIAKAIEEQL